MKVFQFRIITLFIASILGSCQVSELVLSPIVIKEFNISEGFNREVAIDIAKDSTPDIIFRASNISDLDSNINFYYDVEPANQNEIMGDHELAAIYQKGDTIGPNPISSSNWLYSTERLATAYWRLGQGVLGWTGLWVGASHKYLPLRLSNGGKNLYGWIELSVDTTTSLLHIHRSAYDTRPNHPIRAGETQ